MNGGTNKTCQFSTASWATLLVCWLFITSNLSFADISAPSTPTDVPLAEPLNKPLSIVLSPNTIADTQLFLAGRSIHELRSYNGEHSRPDVASFILLQQALYKGGYKGELEVHAVMPYLRNQRYVSVGKIALLGEPIWFNDVSADTDKLFISSAVLNHGEFVVGLYVNPGQSLATNAPSAKQLKNYSAASNRWLEK